MLKPEQVRMARAALRITLIDLANIADVNPNTINRFETGKGGINMRTAEALENAFREAGIELVPENGGGPGVRLRASSIL